MNTSNGFYKIAKRYCDLLESKTKFEINDSRELLLLLSELYNKALQLQEAEPTTDTEIKIEHININFEERDTYWEIHNPYECDEPVCGSLSDDFADIYKDLKTGIFLYEQNLFSDALWYWHLMFKSHWSYHLADALRALNQLLNS